MRIFFNLGFLREAMSLECQTKIAPSHTKDNGWGILEKPATVVFNQKYFFKIE